MTTARAELLEEFRAFLRAGEVPEQFLGAYCSEAESFLASFPGVALESIGWDHVAEYLHAAVREGATERGLRNRRTVSDAVVSFLKSRPPREYPSTPPVLGTFERPAAASARPPLGPEPPTAPPPRVAAKPPPLPARPPVAAKTPVRALTPPPAPVRAAGPASGPAAPRVDPKGRRQFKRVTFIREVEVAGAGRHRCSDVSMGGLYLETVTSFRRGTQLELRFRIEDNDVQPIAVTGRVAYEHPGLGVGVTFLHVAPPDLARLERLIARSPGI